MRDLPAPASTPARHDAPVAWAPRRRGFRVEDEYVALIYSCFVGPLVAAVVVAVVTQDPGYVVYLALMSPIVSLFACAFAAVALLAWVIPSRMLVKRGRAPLWRWWAIAPVAVSGVPLVIGAGPLDVQMFCGRVLVFVVAVWLLERSRRRVGRRR